MKKINVMKNEHDHKIDVFWGASPERDHPALVSSITEGKKIMRRKRKEGFDSIVMYDCFMDGEGTSNIYFFDKDGEIKMESSH
jgi:hypothetical protein